MRTRSRLLAGLAMVFAFSPAPKACADEPPRITILIATSSLPDTGDHHQYGPQMAFDGDPLTAWVEGIPGHGIGERLELALDREITIDAIAVMPGFFDARYHKTNNRVRTLNVRTESMAFALPFRDEMKRQRLRLSQPIKFKRISFEIADVHEGRDPDTCIAEIVFYRNRKKIELLPPAVPGLSVRPGMYIWTREEGYVFLRSDGSVLDIPEEVTERWMIKDGPLFSADGSIILYHEDGDLGLVGEVIVKADRATGFEPWSIFKGSSYTHPLAISGDNEKLLFSLDPGSETEKRKLCVVNLDGSGFEELQAFDQRTYVSARWLSDNRRIVYWYQNNSINFVHVLDTATGESIKVAEVEAQGRFRDLSPDNRLIFDAWADGEQEFWVDLESGITKHLGKTAATGEYLHWSPDSRYIAFSSKLSGNYDLYVMNADGSNRRRLTDRPSDIICAGWTDDGRNIVFQEYYPRYEGAETRSVLTIGKDGSDSAVLWDVAEVFDLMLIACPFLYAYDGAGYINLGEVLGNHRGKGLEKTGAMRIADRFVVSGKLKLRIAEERMEETFIDSVNLRAGSETLRLLRVRGELSEVDESYIRLLRGDTIDLEFDVPEHASSDLTLLTTGFYVPAR